MNLKEIAIEQLRVLGYDGLVDPGVCSCCLDDLMPCDEPGIDCEAGYKVACDYDCKEEHGGWHIQVEKPG